MKKNLAILIIGGAIFTCLQIATSPQIKANIAREIDIYHAKQDSAIFAADSMSIYYHETWAEKKSKIEDKHFEKTKKQ